MLEITVWIVGIYLVACLLTRPPHTWFVRTVNYNVVPPLIVSERPRSDLMADVHPLRLFPAPSLRQWKEQIGPGGGPMTGYEQVIGKPDVPRVFRWLLGIVASTCLAAAGCRLLSKLLSEPPTRAFPVDPSVAEIETAMTLEEENVPRRLPLPPLQI